MCILAWQFTSQQPIYLQIVDELRQRIFSGAYPMGEKLPSVRELAMVAAVNPNTMQRALSVLENQGLVSTQRNSGRTVTTEQAVIDAARQACGEQLADTFLKQMYALGMEKEAVLKLLSERGAQPDEKEDGNGLDS